MSHRYWRSNLALRRLAIGVAAALAVGHGVAVAKLETSDYAKRVNSHTKTHQADLGEALIAWPVYAEPYEPDCQSPKGRDEADLCAQRRMADAAEELSTLTLAQTIVGALAFGGLIATLIISIFATRAATASARASIEAANLSRKAYVAEHRTWLKVYPIEAGPVTFEGETIRVQLAIKIENIGKSPATDVHPTCDVFSGRGFTAGDQEVDDLLAFERKIRQRSGGGFVLLPGDEMSMSFSTPTKTSPHIEAKSVADEAAGVPIENRPLTISAAFCVIYKSPASDDWCYSAGIIYFAKANRTPFDPAFGNVPKEGMRFGLLSHSSKLA